MLSALLILTLAAQSEPVRQPVSSAALDRDATLLVPFEGPAPSDVTEAVAAALTEAGRRVVRFDDPGPRACRERECLAALARSMSLGRVVSGAYRPSDGERPAVLTLVEVAAPTGVVVRRAAGAGAATEPLDWIRPTVAALVASEIPPPAPATGATLDPATGVAVGPATSSAPATVALVFPAWPAGAVVFVDGVERGPLESAAALPGRRFITVAHQGELREGVVSVGEPSTPLELPRVASVDVPLVVESQPSGAEVRLGEQLLGVTPLAVRVAPQAAAALRVSLSGYAEHTWTLDLDVIAWERRGRLTFWQSAELTPLPVPVRFEGVPPNARIVLDGSRVLAARTEIVPGPHEVRITAPGHEPFVRRIELAVGRPARYDIALVPSADYVTYLEQAAMHRRGFIASGLVATVLGAGAGVAFFFGLNESESAHAAHAIYHRATDPSDIDALYAEVVRHRQNAEIGQGVGIGIAAAAAVALGFTLYWKFTYPDDPSETLDLGFTPAPMGAVLRW